jgi:hypothetical protein
VNKYFHSSSKDLRGIETEKICRKAKEYLAHREEIFKAAEEFLAHAFAGIFNSFVFKWFISREHYPLISK